MHINHSYLLHKATQLASQPEARMLDFGCGRGEVVEAGRSLGMQVYGAEVFYDGSTSVKIDVTHKGMLGSSIQEIRNGKLPFPDCYFDVVVSNQVFEHVRDLDAVLREIDRVLKPGGYLLSLFPSKDVIREGHCGIPGLHWFSSNSRIRFVYALLFRMLGLGYHKGNKTARQWVHDFLGWLDEFTWYRDRPAIFRSFGAYFTVSSGEIDYLFFRLDAKAQTQWLKLLMRVPWLQPVFCECFRRFGGLVLLSQKS